MPDYSKYITIGSSGGTLATVGNPPRVWDKPNNVFKLIYTEFRLEVFNSDDPAGYFGIDLTGTRFGTAAPEGSIGEMTVDRVDVHVLNNKGTLIEFWYRGAYVSDATILNGTGEEYAPAAKMKIGYRLSYS